MDKKKLSEKELREEVERGFESYFEDVCGYVYESADEDLKKVDIYEWVRKIIQDC